MIINTLLDQLEAGTAYAQLPMNEQIAMRAITRRLIAMSEKGATPEDWQQLAGYAEWAITPKTQNTLGKLAGATVAGQWIDWSGDLNTPVFGKIDVRRRDGRVLHGQLAGALHWMHHDEPGDIIAYRLVD